MSCHGGRGTAGSGTVGTLGTDFYVNPASRAYVKDNREKGSDCSDPSSLLERCAHLVIHLWVEQGRLRYDAPAGALDAGLRAELTAQKAGLIALLANTPERVDTARDTDPKPPEPGSDGDDGPCLDAIRDPVLPHGAGPLPPRPPTPPSHGLTVHGHVIELSRPRGAREGHRDPVRLVTGAGWSGWYPVTAGPAEGV